MTCRIVSPANGSTIGENAKSGDEKGLGHRLYDSYAPIV